MMESPLKNHYREAAFSITIVDADSFSGGKWEQDDGLPPEIYEDMLKHETFLYFAFMFLNGSVLWAYYSCLAAQNFYAEKFPNVNFPFLTVLVTAWPMVVGHVIQMVFNVERRVSQQVRVIAGYILFMAMGAAIMVLSTVEFQGENGNDLGGYLVLLCFGVIGFSNSLSESTAYSLAALFPIEKFTNGVQIGNTIAGAVNVTLQTVIRLAVGGVAQTEKSSSQSFYIFFSLLILVCLLAIMLYMKVLSTKSMAYLINRNNDANEENNMHLMTVSETISNYMRIFSKIYVPCFIIFLCFFVSLTVFPGFGLSAGRVYEHVKDYPTIYDPVKNTTVPVYPDSRNWYASPGIIASFSYGDLIGRFVCTAAVYRFFSIKLSLILTVSRVGYIVLMLMGVYGTSVYVFGEPTRSTVAIVLLYEIIVNFTAGLNNGVLSTVTMGRAPLMVAPEDREAAASVMVLFLFTGIASGATFGFLVSNNHWFGL